MVTMSLTVALVIFVIFCVLMVIWIIGTHFE